MDFDFSDLSDEDLFLQMQDDLYDGLREEIVAQTHEGLARNYTPQEILDQGLVAGMEIVGVDFRDGILFVPEVLMAANAMKGGMEILRPLLTETGAEQIGKIVLTPTHTYVAIEANQAKNALVKLKQGKIKGKTCRAILLKD